jgi:hypothetical protein
MYATVVIFIKMRYLVHALHILYVFKSNSWSGFSDLVFCIQKLCCYLSFLLNITYNILKICFYYRNAKKCKEKIENMVQEIQDCETKMLGMQKEQEKIESDGKVILDELKAIAVCPAV